MQYQTSWLLLQMLVILCAVGELRSGLLLQDHDLVQVDL